MDSVCITSLNTYWIILILISLFSRLSNLYPNILWIMQKHIWSMPPKEALVYARKEIENAPAVHDDPDLYAPLFRNVSTFKRYLRCLKSLWLVHGQHIRVIDSQELSHGETRLFYFHLKRSCIQYQKKKKRLQIPDILFAFSWLWPSSFTLT